MSRLTSALLLALTIPLPAHADPAASQATQPGIDDGAVEASSEPGQPVAVIALAQTDRAPAAQAPPPDTRPVQLAPMVVVGTRDARPADALTSSVSVIGARDLEFSGASSISESVAALPGVSVEGGPRANGSFINVRGLSGPRVLTIVDGARQNFLGGHRSNLLVDPELLKQIELLRGSASALWGSDALGGVLVLQTKNAEDILDEGRQFGGRFRLGTESASDEQLGSAIVAGRLGAFDAVFNGVSRESDNYERGDGEQQPNTGQDVNSSLAKLSWLPDVSPHSVTFSQQRFVQTNLSPSNPSITITDTNPLIDRTNDTTYSIANYGFDGDAASWGALNWLRSGRFTVYRDALRIREDRVDEPRFDRTQFTTDGGSGHATIALPDRLLGGLLTVGVDGFRDESGATRNGEPRPQFPDSQRQMIGSFAQAELGLGGLTLVPGLRVDRYEASTNQTDTDDVRESQVSPKLGLRYEFAPGLSVRSAYNTAFRAPGLIEVYAAGQHFLGNNFQPNSNLRPESARNLELGFSFDLPGLADNHGSLLSGSIYRNVVEDYIELFVTVETQVPAPQCVGITLPNGCVNRNDDGTINPAVPPIFVGGITSSRNLDSATLQGGELTAAYSIGPLSLRSQYSRVRGTDDSTGQPLLTIPADQIRTTLQLAGAPWVNGVWSGPWLAGLRAELSHRYDFAQNRVPTFIDEDGNQQDVIPKTESIDVWGLSVSWEPRGGRLFGLHAPRLVAGIDNLTDASYRNHLNTLESPGRNLRLSLSAGF